MPKKEEKKERILICLVGHTGRTLNIVLSHTPPAMSSLTHYKSFNFPFQAIEAFLECFFKPVITTFIIRNHICFVFYFFGHMRKPKPFPGSCFACDGVHWWLAAGEKLLRKKKTFSKQNLYCPPVVVCSNPYPSPWTSPLNSTETLWSETQRLILQQSSIQCCLHHGGPTRPARGLFAPLNQVVCCIAWSSSQLQTWGCQGNSTHHCMLSALLYHSTHHNLLYILLFYWVWDLFMLFPDLLIVFIHCWNWGSINKK